MKSIIQNKKECFVCSASNYLEEHHIFHGSANRKISERYGLKVKLCTKHHRDSKEGAHFNKELNIELKQIGQQAFEKKYDRDTFIKLFGKNYLD